MKSKFLIACLLGFSIIATAKEKLPTKKEIVKSMSCVCDWQMANTDKSAFVSGDGRRWGIPNTDWVRGTFLTGIMAMYTTSQKQMYLDSAIVICKRNNWKCGPNFQHADDLCIGQAYLEIFKLKQDSAMIKDVSHRLNTIMANPKRGPVTGWKNDNNWAWCDALFMAPPVFSHYYSITHNKAYLDTMTVLWNDTYNLLYDKQEKLFYRDTRFSPQADGTQKLSKNNKKIFWGRGNGWVVGGLVRVLQDMPKDYPARVQFQTVFKEMCTKIATLQGHDGLWRASLLDTEEYPAPETSGSGFFCYAIMWGVNNGLLPADKYLPVVLKGWRGMTWAIDKKTGMLGWVQAIGADPRSVSAHETMEYGAAAFLLTGSELYKYVMNNK